MSRKKSPTVEYKCLECKNLFCIKEYDANRRNPTFCSDKCYLADKSNKDLSKIGKTYNGLLILSLSRTVLTKRGTDMRKFWNVKCFCGTIFELETMHFTRKKNPTRSCGCLHDRFSKIGKGAVNIIFSRYRGNAKSRGIDFPLTIEEFEYIAIRPCFYCNVVNSQIYKQNENNIFIYNGIDRLDSSKDYKKENCVPCCPQCNIGKMDYTEKEFLEWVSRIYHYKVMKPKLDVTSKTISS